MKISHLSSAHSRNDIRIFKMCRTLSEQGNDVSYIVADGKMDDIVDKEQIELAKHFKKLVSVYQDSRDLVLMGGYTKGQDESIDEAHEMWPKIINFIKQEQNTKASFNDSLEELKALINKKNKNA